MNREDKTLLKLAGVYFASLLVLLACLLIEHHYTVKWRKLTYASIDLLAEQQTTLNEAKKLIQACVTAQKIPVPSIEKQMNSEVPNTL